MRPIAVALVAIAGTFYAGVEQLPARADFIATSSVYFQCAKQGWIVQVEQPPGGGSNRARLISQGNSVDGSFDGNSNFTFASNSYKYQVRLQGSDKVNLKIIDRHTGKNISNQQCSRKQSRKM